MAKNKEKMPSSVKESSWSPAKMAPAAANSYVVMSGYEWLKRSGALDENPDGKGYWWNKKAAPAKTPEQPKADAVPETGGKVYKFENGLTLDIASDNESAKLWEDPTPTPLQIFKEKFPDKKSTDIKAADLNWVQKHYVNKNPILKIKPADLDRQISKYFKVRDLVRIEKDDKAFMVKAGTWAQYEKFMIRENDGQYYWNVARIDPNLCSVLDAVREKVGFSMEINEGVRPFEYNRDMYKARGKKVVLRSPHISGRSVDMRKTGSAEKDQKLAEAIFSVLAGKGGGFGKGLTVYHIDTKIQGGAIGNWIVDEQTGKIRLRVRQWKY